MGHIVTWRVRAARETHGGWRRVCFEFPPLAGIRLFRQRGGFEAATPSVVIGNRGAVLFGMASGCCLDLEAKSQPAEYCWLHHPRFVCGERDRCESLANIGVLSSTSAFLGIVARRRVRLYEPF